MVSEILQSLKGASYAFVDVETTGANSRYGQIIEIGIIRVDDGEIVETFETLIQPDRILPSFITDITGIKDSDLAGKPRFDEVALHIQELLAGAVFVAHNVRFDYGFIKNEFMRLGIVWNAKTLCTVKMSRQLFSEQKSHSLQSIIECHGIKVEKRHRALADAQAMIDFLRVAENKVTPEVVKECVAKCLLTYTLPSTIDPKIIEQLPHAPGVYFFYDKDDTLLYIGKSVDIKNRVRSHFGQDYLSAKERMLTNQVTHIDCETTSGELSALLKESALIKELQPVFNRRLRSASKLAVHKSSSNTLGYKTSTLLYQNKSNIVDLANIEGIFRTLSSGKAVIHQLQAQHQLCPKLSGLETGTGACFQYQLGKCSGACIGKEDISSYNKRFEEAFSKMRLRSWPYNGSIVVPEDQVAEEGTAYVIDQWKIIKKYEYTAEGYVEEEINQPFDFDTYRILSSHILKKNPKIAFTMIDSHGPI